MLLVILLQLVAMCKYMNINNFGTNMMLRMRLERQLREIRQDDKVLYSVFRYFLLNYHSN
jgi:hypothetical protein